MKTILVPTDFSITSRNASVYAIELAKEMNYKVLLLHVYYVPVLMTAEMEDFGATSPRSVDNLVVKNEYQERLKEEVFFLCKNCTVQLEYKALPGLAVEEIIYTEQTEKPDLIVMGLNPKGVLSEFVFGSVATDVIKHTQTPVIIVPERAKFKRIDKIVFASDLRMECDLQMHEPLNDLIEAFFSKILILNVVKESTDRIGKDDGVSGRRIEKYFENKEHIYNFLENNDIIQGINEFIIHNEIDMVTMIPNKYNLIERIFKENNTNKMAFHTTVPLLTLPRCP